MPVRRCYLEEVEPGCYTITVEQDCHTNKYHYRLEEHEIDVHRDHGFRPYSSETDSCFEDVPFDDYFEALSAGRDHADIMIQGPFVDDGMPPITRADMVLKSH